MKKGSPRMNALEKPRLRRTLRAARRAHAEAQPDAIRALLFHRPPAPLLEKFSAEASIGFYHARDGEAPTAGYAKFFHERGHTIALPRLASKDAAMEFRVWDNPFSDDELEDDPFGAQQPSDRAEPLAPDILFVPLIGFTASGDRLGQGGGHYDRWLAQHPGRLAIGLAWDIQLCETLPVEPHDIALDAVITPTRMFGIG